MEVKRKTPRGVWALRGVTITIAVVVIVVVGTVAYSAYEDYTTIKNELAGGSNQASGHAVINGNTETISINITIPNRGLYTLNVTLTCNYPNSNVVCNDARVSVSPGGQDVLRFEMTVANLQEFDSSSSRSINGTVAIAMPPFASVDVVTDFGGFVSPGGA